MRSASMYVHRPVVERLRGFGVHSGLASALALRCVDGPIVLAVEESRRPLDALELVDTTRSTNVRVGDAVVRTVEHLFAAMGGLGIRSGLLASIEGGEVPLLDGGALAFAEALRRLGASASPPRTSVVKSEVVEIGGSRYEFRPGPTVHVEVELDFPGTPIESAKRASWTGDAEDFLRRIAPARTFVLEREIAALGEASLAKFADASSVVIVGERLFGAGTVAADEPARHKLLDLVGDLMLHGGPPRGSVIARRPGHRGNHAALAIAKERHIVVEIG